MPKGMNVHDLEAGIERSLEQAALKMRDNNFTEGLAHTMYAVQEMLNIVRGHEDRLQLGGGTTKPKQTTWEDAAKVVESHMGSPGAQAPNKQVDAALKKVAADLRAHARTL